MDLVKSIKPPKSVMAESMDTLRELHQQEDRAGTAYDNINEALQEETKFADACTRIASSPGGAAKLVELFAEANKPWSKKAVAATALAGVGGAAAGLAAGIRAVYGPFEFD